MHKHEDIDWLTRTSAKKSFEQGQREVCAVTREHTWSDLSLRKPYKPWHGFFRRPTYGFKAS